MPARKLFALSGTNKRKHNIQVISDYEDDDDDLEDFVEPQSSKKAKFTKSTTSSTQIDDMKQDIKKINENLDCIFKLSKDMKMPPALHKLITDTFRCHICHGVPTPPPIYGKCCKQILGCQECIDKWYTTGGGINNT